MCPPCCRVHPVVLVALFSLWAPLAAAGSNPPAAPGDEPLVRLERMVVTPSRFSLSPEGDGSIATLTHKDLETLPQVGEDLFRSIARLPGVAADDFTAKFWVRGAPQRQLLVRLDGADLLEPFHLKDVDGALSIIDLQIISRLDLMTGGFNSDFGNRAGGVLAMETLTPARPRPSASLGLSLTGMRGGTGGTFAQGAGRWLGSIRRGYPDIALRFEGRAEEIFPRYWDAYGKVEYDISPDHTVSLHALHSADTLRVEDNGGPDLRSSYDSDALWARWRGRFNDKLSAESVLTQSWLAWRRDGAGLYANRYRLDLHDRRTLASTAWRQDWSLALNGRALVRAGWFFETGSASYAYSLYREDPVVENGVIIGRPRTLRLALEPDGNAWGGFVAPRFAFTSQLAVEPGLRFDRNSATGDRDVSPRLNAVHTLAKNTTLRAAWGRYVQAQGLHELAVPFDDPSFYPAEKAEHRILGLEHLLAKGFNLRLEAFQRITADPRPHWLNRYDIYNIFPEAQTDRLQLRPQQAEARGLEMIVQRRGQERFDWTLSYAWSKAQETVGSVKLPGLRDQRHAFYGDLAYAPHPRWRFSAAWQYHTGWPITDVGYSLVSLNGGGRAIVRSFGPTLGARLPAYHRLDLRASHLIPLRHGGLKVFVDVFNAYDQANPIAYDYDPAVVGGVLSANKKPRNMLPLIPSIGVSWDL